MVEAAGIELAWRLEITEELRFAGTKPARVIYQHSNSRSHENRVIAFCTS